MQTCKTCKLANVVAATVLTWQRRLMSTSLITISAHCHALSSPRCSLRRRFFHIKICRFFSHFIQLVAANMWRVGATLVRAFPARAFNKNVLRMPVAHLGRRTTLAGNLAKLHERPCWFYSHILFSMLIALILLL